MIRWFRLLLRWIGFDVCPHTYSRWEDEYTHSYEVTTQGAMFDTYGESSSKPHTHLRQTRRCHECYKLEIRHINLKKSKQVLDL